MKKTLTFEEIDFAMNRAEKERDTYSTRMQKILTGINRIRRSDEPMDRAISFFENISNEHLIQIFYFGGFVRDAYLGLKPRDLDIVVNCNFEGFRKYVHSFFVRENRFGGLKLKVHGVDVDAWKVNDTDAFKRKVVYPPSLHLLPEMTVFNVESIVLEVFAPEGNYWGWEKGFFEGCDTKTLEVQNSHNADFHEKHAVLTLARTSHLQKQLGWGFGPVLKEYVKRQLKIVNLQEIKEVYQSHYRETCDLSEVLAQLHKITL